MKGLLIILLVLCAPSMVRAEYNPGPRGDINVDLASVNVGPTVSGGVLRLSAAISFSDAAHRKQLGTKEHPWWKSLQILATAISPDHLRRANQNPPRSVEKQLGHLTPALDNPLDPITATGLESDVHQKDFILELHPARVQAGWFYLITAVLDTRELAKENPQIAPLFVPQVGGFVLQVRAPLEITDSGEQFDMLTDRYYGELLSGQFEKAKITNYAKLADKQAPQRRFDAIVAEAELINILLYQGKFQEAVKQYEKVLQLDEKAAAMNPDVEAIVTRRTFSEFKAKIEKKLAEQRNK